MLCSGKNEIKRSSNTKEGCRAEIKNEWMLIMLYRAPLEISESRSEMEKKPPREPNFKKSQQGQKGGCEKEIWQQRKQEVRVRGKSCETQQKKTCGSTVFSPGHPRQYSLAPAMLVCADRTRRGRFIAVWPQMKNNVSTVNIYSSKSPKSCNLSSYDTFWLFAYYNISVALLQSLWTLESYYAPLSLLAS